MKAQYKNEVGEWVDIKSYGNLLQDALRYRWLRRKYAIGEETYLAEGIVSEKNLDEYIDDNLNT